MKTNAQEAHYEGILSEQYSQPLFLPPLWRIIFQEAMRGNHLLFSRSVQAEAALLSLTAPNEELVEFCVHLFAAPDLRTIKSMIHLLPREEQVQLYAVYLQQMQGIRDENKRSMN
ncbi:MAG: hypothetical protein H7249_11125 [Chitinophagaceae bacterium]|nr:hypothetical protein [Oligoflexus sp.]